MTELNDQAETREMEGGAMFPELAHLIKSSELEVPTRFTSYLHRNSLAVFFSDESWKRCWN